VHGVSRCFEEYLSEFGGIEEEEEDGEREGGSEADLIWLE